ncbi:MAG: NYN domain-containing protein [Quinella sp. 3Q1]|nr:NYN domain-containing protein [Quinella sp. 3Q1]MBQ3452207.1 NYN domain-containing protein [Selenomonadaceae bacterium]MBQ4403407.1 NYN domain-containing protein [Selenomonadaceae bacterium]MBQ6132366.1 NYN domain-containing protein [Selenomonadaceae bacterium]MBQ7492944.1 NYN domain-containing protein [Selenomonadaceae bacterium]
MAKKRPHYLVDGYNLIHVWQEINTDDLATAREFLIRNLHEYGAYEKFEITLVFDAARNEDEERTEVFDNFFRVVYSGFNETADSVIERLSYEEVRKRREVHVVSSDATIETVILGAGAYRHPSAEFYRAIKRAKQHLRKEYLGNVTLPVQRNEVGDRIGADVFAKLEKLRRGK